MGISHIYWVWIFPEWNISPAQNLDMSSFKYFLALDILQPSTAYISHPNLSFSWNMIHIHFLTPPFKRILKDVCRASQWRWIIFVDAADQQMFDIDYVFNKLSLFIGKSWDSEVNLLLGSPDFALAAWVHGWADRTLEVSGEVGAVRERAFHPG